MDISHHTNEILSAKGLTFMAAFTSADENILIGIRIDYLVSQSSAGISYEVKDFIQIYK